MTAVFFLIMLFKVKAASHKIHLVGVYITNNQFLFNYRICSKLIHDNTPVYYGWKLFYVA